MCARQGQLGRTASSRLWRNLSANPSLPADWVKEGFCLFFLVHFNFLMQLQFIRGFLPHQKIISWRSIGCKDCQRFSVTFTSTERKMAYCYFSTSTKILPARIRHAGLLIIELVLCFVLLEYYNAIFLSIAHLDQKKMKSKRKMKEDHSN